MNTWQKFGLVAPLALMVALHTSDADACGGCFVPPEENTQVTGHRMIMSIGMDQSTLYDQIEYTGAPESFAWVLPTKGTVDVGVSSDLVFNQLGFDTQVRVYAPPRNCPWYNCYGGAEDQASGFGSVASASAGTGGSVNVIAQEVVGPYETVQLESTDPEALSNWLSDHGYKLPDEIAPIVTAYVNDGFNFLAVKLVPGKDVQAMQPIRITTVGSNVALPLRMVAAGTGATTTVTLFVVSEFRSETANFPTFLIPPEDVVWDYSLDRSNYTDLRDAQYASSKGFAWLAESSFGYSPVGFRSQIANVISFGGPGQSGYGDDPEKAQQAADEDMDVLFAKMDENSVWVTRLRAELSRAALATDLVLQAADAQKEIPSSIQTTKFVGEEPECPPPPPGCDDPNGSSGDPASGDEYWGAVARKNRFGGACTMGESGLSEAAFGSAMLILGLALYRRRTTS
jgi:hypothetical protein